MSPIDLLIAEVPLVPEDAVRDAWLGPAARAVVLASLSRVDSAAAARLHDEGARRPYTVSVLSDARGAPARLRATALEPETAGMIQRAMERLPERIDLNGTRCRVPGDAVRALGCGYDELVQDAERAGPFRSLHFRFETAATFRARGRNRPFPSPELVFGSLASAWRSYATVGRDLAGGAVPDAAAEALVFGEYHLETVPVVAAHHPELAFRGEVSYRPARRRREVPSQLWRLLTQFAPFAGVGAKTTHGLGAVRTRIE